MAPADPADGQSVVTSDYFFFFFGFFFLALDFAFGLFFGCACFFTFGFFVVLGRFFPGRNFFAAPFRMILRPAFFAAFFFLRVRGGVRDAG